MKDAIFRAEIAQHLKSERKKKGLSLDKAAKLTGVSKAMLGQIEREESYRNSLVAFFLAFFTISCSISL